MATSQSRLERVYVQDQTAFDLIPGGNTAGSGTANVANGNCMRHIKVTLSNEVSTLVRRDKTGSRSATVGVKGREFGRFALEASLAPNGTAGSAPDFEPILKAVFGQSPTTPTGTVSVSGATNASPIVVTTATHSLASGDLVNITGITGNTAANGIWVINVLSGTTFELLGSSGNAAYGTGGTVSKVCRKYTFVDDPLLQFALWSFRQPSTLAQRVAYGCSPNEMTFNLGQDISEFSVSGECKFVLDSDYFSSATAEEKGGISAMPTEPSSPTTNGGIIAGFTGRAVIGGATIARIRTATIKISNGSALVKDTFGKSMADEIEADQRSVTVSFNFYDTDDASIKAIKNAGITKTPMDFIFNLGTVTGSTVVLWLKQVQLETPALDDGQRRFSASVAESRAYGTSPTAKDELVMFIA